MKKTFCLMLLFIACSQWLEAQHIEILTKGTPASIRGLSVVNDQVVWVSGSNGRVGKSLDGGKNWTWMQVKGFEKADFRDIEAFDHNTAIIMGIAEPAYILKTADGGDTWKTVYENKTSGIFLDAMEFFDGKSGIVIGDPIKGKFFLARTSNQGESWKELPYEERPSADSGEACFASSGTNIRTLYGEAACFISGGNNSRYFSSGFTSPLPLVHGTKSTGANSIAVGEEGIKKNNRTLVVVGGDFAADSISVNNCVISANSGKTWIVPEVSPHGYRSCVEFISQKQLITCGTSGVDISIDGGMNWKLVSGESFHVCKKAKKGSSIFLAGTNGKVGKLIMK